MPSCPHKLPMCAQQLFLWPGPHPWRLPGVEVFQHSPRGCVHGEGVAGGHQAAGGGRAGRQRWAAACMRQAGGGAVAALLPSKMCPIASTCPTPL